ncbi:hypothetical protein C1H71_19375 [Iodobacter fluviatilis]|uniref:DNA recombination protein RmuC n=2 Tax=Iodobacter fluviatilis TaxID=537 RepID=A0A7G3GEC0_9NEIS|nr:hypothetical protein C1H71_19375 [Iodobacter fluviatilis]
MLDLLFGITTLVVLLAGALVVARLQQLAQSQRDVLDTLTQDMEAKHREMLSDLHEGLVRQTENTHSALTQQGLSFLMR